MPGVRQKNQKNQRCYVLVGAPRPVDRDTFEGDFFLYTAGRLIVLAGGQSTSPEGQALPHKQGAKQHRRKEMSAHMSIGIKPWHGPCNWKQWNRGSDEPGRSKGVSHARNEEPAKGCSLDRFPSDACAA